MQIAKMFGALGFQVDLTGLQQFKQEMKLARSQIRAFATDSGQAEISVKSLTGEIKKLKNSLNFKVKTTGVKSGFQSIATAVKDTAKAFGNFERKSVTLNTSIESIQVKLDSALPAWERYRLEVEATARAIGAIRGSVPTPRGTTSNSKISSSSQSREGYTPNNTALYFGGLAGGGLFNSARQAIVGGMASAVPFALGAITKNVISSGRNMRSANQVLLAHSLDENDYKGNRQYLDKLTSATGSDIIESTKGFGRILSATRAGGGTTQQAQNVFEAFSKYGMTMHLSQDENKRMVKAVEQIYTNQRILGGEINQFANVGIPMKAILKEISEGKLGGNSKEIVPEEIKKLAGSKAPNTVQLAEWIAKYLMNTAQNNGALEKAQHSSQAEQGRASNEWTHFSEYVMENGGDDTLASLYRTATSLITAMKDLTVAINFVSDSINKITGSSGAGKFLWILIALLIPIGRLGKGASILTRVLRMFSGYMTKSGRAISMATGASGGLIARFTVMFGWLWKLIGRWTIYIYLLQKVIELGEDIANNDKEPKITWVDKAILGVQILSLQLSILKLKWAEFTGNINQTGDLKTDAQREAGIQARFGNFGGLGGGGFEDKERYQSQVDRYNSVPSQYNSISGGDKIGRQTLNLYLQDKNGVIQSQHSQSYDINFAHDTFNQAHIGL